MLIISLATRPLVVFFHCKHNPRGVHRLQVNVKILQIRMGWHKNQERQYQDSLYT